MDTKPNHHLRAFYQNLTPKHKRQLLLLGITALILLVSTLLVLATSEDNELPSLKKQRKIEYNLFNGKNPREVSLDALANKLNKLTNDLIEVRASYQQQDKKIKEAKDLIVETSKLINEQTRDLKDRYEELDRKLANAKEILDNQVPLPDVSVGIQSSPRSKSSISAPSANPPPSFNNLENHEQSGLKIRVFTGSGEEGKKTSQAATSSVELAKRRKFNDTVNIKKASMTTGMPDVYLPSGTLVSGVLMTGLDAPTSNQSRMDPFPALLRIKHEAILPNFFKMDIAECFVIASGFGDLSSERAYMRAERLSCVKKDGTVIETPMDAYSVGEDGKAGVRGRLISKNGQVIGNALLAGFVSGLGKAFAPQRIQPLTLNPSNVSQYQYPSPEAVGGQALSGGVNSAADQLAAYYLEMAKNIFPVIEVDAGRKIDFVLVRGMSLVGKSRSTSVLPDRITSTSYGPVTKHHGTYGNIGSNNSGLSNTLNGFTGTNYP